MLCWHELVHELSTMVRLFLHRPVQPVVHAAHYLSKINTAGLVIVHGVMALQVTFMTLQCCLIVCVLLPGALVDFESWQ